MATRVSLAMACDAEERLLQQLAPVREVFNIRELAFDELMQRDIDDGRVSSELIPYLLEDKGEALVKLFPPIIVVVLPTGPNGRPASAYPAVESFQEQDSQHASVNWQITRSGAVGAEAFEFKQMIAPNGQIIAHDYAQLKLNTTRCRLAIVDGQHRAMALLALYRNFKQWPEKTLQYRDYYKRWARSVIDRYDLTGIQLPVLLCTFPSLHEGNSERRIKTAEACRSVFLALNKNAKPVTRARNHLLNDDDLMAHFLRRVLSHVKEQDANSSMSLRLWNFELDSEGDKRILSSPMSISGVMHLYGMIEFLMLNKHEVTTLAHAHNRKQKLARQKDLTDCMRRLGAHDLLPADVVQRANRKLIERETAAVLTEQFFRLFGRFMVRLLDEFWPYRVHNTKAMELETALRAEAYGSTYHSILFEGQGIGRVFESYLEHLQEQREERKDSGQPSPELEASYKDFRNKDKELQGRKEKFFKQRVTAFLDGVPAKTAEQVFSAVHDIYRYTFTTQAFQYALAITFFAAAEQCRKGEEFDADVLPEATLDAWFTEYLDQLNQFFHPQGPKAAWSIIRTFYGDVKGGYGTTPAEVAPSSTCMKKILIPGELKPAEWSKFRYLLLELWQPTAPVLAAHVTEQREKLRNTALVAFEARELAHAAKRRGMLPADLPDKSTKKIKKDARILFARALGHLGVTVVPESFNEERELQRVSEETQEHALEHHEDADVL